jgi:hypothetical protein
MGCGKCPKAHKNPYAGAVDVDSAIYSIDFDLIGPGPELRIPGAAAQTRAVSMAGIRLGPWESARAFKGIICGDISEFESDMPSHAVGLSQVRSPAIFKFTHECLAIRVARKLKAIDVPAKAAPVNQAASKHQVLGQRGRARAPNFLDAGPDESD